LRAKLKQLPDEILAHALPDGEANLVIGVIPYVPQFGAELLGPLPAEVQIRIGFAAARGSSATEVQAAEALLAYLHTPEAVAVLKAKGFEPK
jgi:molybdate transport system substrate-binding protein